MQLIILIFLKTNLIGSAASFRIPTNPIQLKLQLGDKQVALDNHGMRHVLTFPEVPPRPNHIQLIGLFQL